VCVCVCCFGIRVRGVCLLDRTAEYVCVVFGSDSCFGTYFWKNQQQSDPPIHLLPLLTQLSKTLHLSTCTHVPSHQFATHRGTYSVVYDAIKIGTMERVAIKAVNKARSEDKRLLLEISVLKRMKHPNIVKLFEVKETADTVYLITEKVGGGELFVRISEHGAFSESGAKDIMRNILHAVAYLHKQGIVHRLVGGGLIVVGCGSGQLEMGHKINPRLARVDGSMDIR